MFHIFASWILDEVKNKQGKGIYIQIIVLMQVENDGLVSVNC